MIGYKNFHFYQHGNEVFDAIADKEIQDREEEQLDFLAREIDEIKRLLVEIKEKQAATRGLVDTFRGADYDLDAVYERARQWRHARDDWSREYTPTPPPIQSCNINASEKSFLEELEEAGDTMEPVDIDEEDENDAAEIEETATAAKEVEDTAAGDATEGDAAEGAEETTQTDAAETAEAQAQG
ncbi:hypothetical protein ACHWQZ_G017532 [Mnemiopsis leidyi]